METAGTPASDRHPAASGRRRAPSGERRATAGARPVGRARRRRGGLRRAATTLAVVAALTVAVELIVRLTGVKAFVFPPPSAVLAELVADPGTLFAARRARTLYVAAAGLALGAAVALALRRGGAAFAPPRPHPHARRDRVPDHPGHRPGAAAGPVARLRRPAARHRVRAHRLLPHGRDGAARACAPPTPSCSCCCARSTPRRWDVFWRVRVPGAAPLPRRRAAHRCHAQPGRRRRRRVDRRRPRSRLPRPAAPTRAWRPARPSPPCSSSRARARRLRRRDRPGTKTALVGPAPTRTV